jgi:hypothetical protein
MFFENLLQQVYCNQTIGNIVICGDFNSRCGYYSDFIEGVDEISKIVRNIIDPVFSRICHRFMGSL